MALRYSNDQKRNFNDSLRNPDYDPALTNDMLGPFISGPSLGSDSGVDMNEDPEVQSKDFSKLFCGSYPFDEDLTMSEPGHLTGSPLWADVNMDDLRHDSNLRGRMPSGYNSTVNPQALHQPNNVEGWLSQSISSSRPASQDSAPSSTLSQLEIDTNPLYGSAQGYMASGYNSSVNAQAYRQTNEVPGYSSQSESPSGPASQDSTPSSALSQLDIETKRFYDSAQRQAALAYNSNLNDRAYRQTSEVPGYSSMSVSPSGPASPDAAPSPYKEMRSIREEQLSLYQHQRQNLDVMSEKMSTRVETALDIRLELSNVGNTWSHIQKIRLHPQHMTKQKYLQDLMTTPMDGDTLELRATPFSSVAMKDPNKRFRLLAGAGKVGEVLDAESPRPSPGVISASGDERVQAHDGEPIRMCQLCIDREKKRLLRSNNEKKKKKVEESEIWLTEASQKVIVINNKPILDCKRASSYLTNSATQLMNATSAPSPQGENNDQGNKGKKKSSPLPPVKEGTIVVDIAMRICCYCRHHKDPDGFHVIFNLVDVHRKVVAQVVTEPITITDDHKEKKGRISPTAPAPAPFPQQFFGQGMLGAGSAQDFFGTMQPSHGLPHASSTPNLPATGHNLDFRSVYQPQFAPGYYLPYNPSALLATPFATHPTTYQPFLGLSSNTRTSSSPHLQTLNRPHVHAPIPSPSSSRPDSPSGLQGRQTKRRRGNLPGRVASELRMTPINHTQHRQPPDNMPIMSSLNDQSPTAPHGLPTVANHTPPPKPSNTNQAQTTQTDGQPETDGQANGQVRTDDGSPTPEIIVAGISPNSGPTAGGTRVMLAGSGFTRYREHLEVYFNGHRATDLEAIDDLALLCTTPRADGPGLVGVQVVAPYNIVSIRHNNFARWFTYIDGNSDARPSTISLGPREMDDDDRDDEQNAMYPRSSQEVHQANASRLPGSGTSHSNGTFVSREVRHRQVKYSRQSSMSSMSTMSVIDTPPPYEEVKAADLETKMRLDVVDAVLEKRMTTTTEVVQRRREVKGLGSDFKLWYRWIPSLVILLALAIYTQIYFGSGTPSSAVAA